MPLKEMVLFLSIPKRRVPTVRPLCLLFWIHKAGCSDQHKVQIMYKPERIPYVVSFRPFPLIWAFDQDLGTGH